MKIIDISPAGAVIRLSSGECERLGEALDKALGAPELQRLETEALYDSIETLGATLRACSGLLISGGRIQFEERPEWHARLEALGLIEAKTRF